MKAISNKDFAEIIDILSYVKSLNAKDTKNANRIRKSSVLIRKLKSPNNNDKLVKIFCKHFTYWWNSPSMDAEDMIQKLQSI